MSHDFEAVVVNTSDSESRCDVRPGPHMDYWKPGEEVVVAHLTLPKEWWDDIC